MGHCSVLVIGADAQDQLLKYQRFEYADPFNNRHIVAVDRLEEAKTYYDTNTARIQCVYGSISFLDWVKKNYGVAMLAEGQEADFFNQHKNGWFRTNADGEVIELFERTIHDGHWDWFEATIDCLKLKPGAVGSKIHRYSGEEQPAEGYAGIARKSAIDFDGMRDDAGKKATGLWDAAAAVYGSQTWIHLDDLRKEYPDNLYTLADKEYWEQPAIRAMNLADDIPNHLINDWLSLPRDQYIQLARDGAIDAEFTFMVKDFQLLEEKTGGQKEIEEQSRPRLMYWKRRREARYLKINSMLDSLPDDTLFTAVSVHA